MTKLGIYMIGARGNVATCVSVGLLALREELAPKTGLVTALDDFADAQLCPFGEIAIGGCDVVSTPLKDKAHALSRDRGVLPSGLVAQLGDALSTLDRSIDFAQSFATGTCPPEGYRATISKITNDLRAFKTREQAEQVVVINLASTEPSIELSALHHDLDALDGALNADENGIATQSMLYAYAALSHGMGFINFTPNQANDIPALDQLAHKCAAAHAGKDGKTGETLIKTALGPMFTARNLKVRSWLANNYLGNNDGKTLSDPAARQTKLASKDEALRSILGPDAYLSTEIGYAPDMGDWKTAIDQIHFEGFLGTPMSMQFTWSGCDSALAAPLVIDLARLTERALRAGESGCLDYLASFFKSPLGTNTHALSAQLDMLAQHCERWTEADASSTQQAHSPLSPRHA